MSNSLFFIVSLLATLLRNLRTHGDCPDGLCDEPLAKADALSLKLCQPSVGATPSPAAAMLPDATAASWFILLISNLGAIIQCAPRDRIFAVIRRFSAVWAKCDRCNDGDCSIFDWLTCVDAREVVSIVQEIMSIVEDSRICIEGGQEITLGQVPGAA